jgi:hypothetical protein
MMSLAAPDGLTMRKQRYAAEICPCSMRPWQDVPDDEEQSLIDPFEGHDTVSEAASDSTSVPSLPDDGSPTFNLLPAGHQTSTHYESIAEPAIPLLGT